MANGNGNNVAKWISVALVIVGMGTAAVVSVSTRPTRAEVERIADKGDEHLLREVQLMFRDVETKQDFTNSKLDRIEAKLDEH